MKRIILLTGILIISLFEATRSFAQCSICTKTAQQLGDGPAQGFNTGILYLAFLPLGLIAFFGIRWWINERKSS